ncbi:MAG: hypothetical protein Q7S38_00110 [bacterium]|nr:hypothetical protein [bacterium]
MNNDQLENLVTLSYTGDSLDEKTVLAVASRLKRESLKRYIKELRMRENKNRVIVTLPFQPDEKDKKRFGDIFAGKKILFNIDQSLLMGIQIINSDIIYNLNLKDSLERVVSHVSKYD